MNISHVERSEEPDRNDRLHRVADRLLETFTLDPEASDLKVIVFVNLDLGDGRDYATTAASGYEDDTDIVTTMMAHLGAMFKANGMDIQFVPMDKPIGGQG